MKDEKTMPADVQAEDLSADANSRTSAKKKNAMATASAVDAEKEAFARKETIRLPRNKDLGDKQQEFYSVNGRNFMVQLGKSVEVPEPVANLVKQNQAAEDAAYEYESSLPTASAPEK